MVDWQGLFNWSIMNSDGTSESQFKQMNDEDKKFLEDAMKQYTFNDSNKLKEICEDIKSHMILDKEKIVSLLEDLLDIAELHPRNNINLCLCGGLQTLVQIIVINPHDEARRLGCTIFSQVVQNNPEVQQIAQKIGSLNLMTQYEREKNPPNKEAVFGALSSFLRGNNFKAKKEFLRDFAGLHYLLAVILTSENVSLRLAKKAVFLMHDFVIND